MLNFVDEVFCGLYVYMYYCVFVFSPFIPLLVFLCSYPVAGMTFCVYWSVTQQRPVEISLWAVLIYFFCKLFFRCSCNRLAFNYFEFYMLYLCSYRLI
jgi:hypothetical protein